MPTWKRLIRFIAQEDGFVYSGEPLNTTEADLGLCAAQGRPIKARVLQGSSLSPRATLGSKVLTVKQLLSPLDPLVIKTVRALGTNFQPPTEFKKTDIPILFYKPITSISSTGASIPIPRFAAGENVDYETELCIVISKTCKDVKKEDALSYILGYTVAQDVSSRTLCAKGIQWGLGKSFDGWLPLGPCLVARDSISDLDSLELKTYVNGELKQHAKIPEMLFGVAETISILSQGTTLEAGSLILMGTPPAIEAKEGKDRQWLKDGDQVQASIPGIGSIYNTIREESSQVKAKL